MKTFFYLTSLISILLIPISCSYDRDEDIYLHYGPSDPGYAEYIAYDLSKDYKMVILSGSTSYADSDGQIIGKDDIAKQTEVVFENIKATLKKEGGTMDNLVQIKIYMTDMNDLLVFEEVRDKYVNTLNPPTSTAIQVAKLWHPDVKLEVQANAIIKK